MSYHVLTRRHTTQFWPPRGQKAKLVNTMLKGPITKAPLQLKVGPRRGAPLPVQLPARCGVLPGFATATASGCLARSPLAGPAFRGPPASPAHRRSHLLARTRRTWRLAPAHDCHPGRPAALTGG